MKRAASAERTWSFTESVIREMTRVCADHNGVNLAQGFPDFPAPELVKNAAIDAISRDINQYAITWGAKAFRDAIADHANRFYDMQVDPETMVTACCGSTEAMISALVASVNPGEEVVILEPHYENYGPGAAIAGAKPVYHALRPPFFRVEKQELRKSFSSKTAAIIINSPNNPTGRVFDRDELRAIADLCIEYDCVAITDEIYEHIIYEGHRHIPLATLDGMAERTITIGSCSKTFSVTGWRLGYAIAAPDRTDAIRKVHDFVTVGAPAPLQEAGAIALKMPDSYFADLGPKYQVRRDKMLSALQNCGLKPVNCPEGAYYILVDISEFRWPSDDLFARELVKRVGIATVPGSSFFDDPTLGRHLIRFCYPKRTETLDMAAQLLLEGIDRMRTDIPTHA